MVWPLKPRTADDYRPAEVSATGTVRSVRVELSYEDGVDNWWYAGRLAVAEAGDTGVEWDADARRLVVGQDPAMQNRMPLRTYWLLDVPKEDRRILRTVGLDLIESAPRIPYNRTNEGARRIHLLAFAGMISLELMTIVLLLALPSAVLDGTADASVVRSSVLWFVPVVLAPVVAFALYWRSARRTVVPAIDVAPVNDYAGPSKDELVYLANSATEPAPIYFRRLFGLSAREV